MRIAAGVLIIIVAVFDLISGFGYALGGAFVAGGSGFAEQVAQQAAKQGGDPKAIKELQAIGQKAGEMGATAGGAIMAFGFFLLVMCGLCIAAGVVLFREKAATFALVIGILQLASEGIGFLIIPEITIVGILIKAFVVLAAVLVIVGAISYRGKPAAPVPM